MTSFKLFNPIKRDAFTFLEARRKRQEKRGSASSWLHLVKHRENLVLPCAPKHLKYITCLPAGRFKIIKKAALLRAASISNV